MYFFNFIFIYENWEILLKNMNNIVLKIWMIIVWFVMLCKYLLLDIDLKFVSNIIYD